MTSKRKSHKISLKNIFYLFIFAALAVGIIFIIDFFAQKTGTNNEITQKAHSAREQVEDFASDIKTKIQDISEKKQETISESEIQVVSSEDSFPAVKEEIFQFPDNLELPLCAASKTGTAPDHQIRRFANFTICYRESYEQAEWAAYCLEKEELEKNASRGNDFRADPEITTGSASLADYKKSGYDRGHLAPAADFAFSEEAMSESFFLSNMSPQAPGLNREIWQYLEGQVRTWADEYGKVYVITGPVLEKTADQYEFIGENQVSVPEFYYKVVLSPFENTVKALAFIIPNQKCQDTFWDYVVTVDEVEKRTGLDFFYILDDFLESRLESQVSVENWR